MNLRDWGLLLVLSSCAFVVSSAPLPWLFDQLQATPLWPPFDSKFVEASQLALYNYTGQASNIPIECAATFPDWLPEANVTPGFTSFVETLQSGVDTFLAQTHQYGLFSLFSMDMIVLPKDLVLLYKDEIVDEKTGRISVRKQRTLDLLSAMFAELFDRFPAIDAIIVRVGEVYLTDFPFHTGDGAVDFDETFPEQQQEYIILINFLRDVICVRHKKFLFFRTWDTSPERFHANPTYYLNVTDMIEPHDLLFFSIKHTMLDFWRHVQSNPCLTLGQHRQVIEVQCQREYEGKGAYPSYVGQGVIEGFPELQHPIGLQDLLAHQRIAGVFTWSRGGGWYGPRTKRMELWQDLNTYVISQYAARFGATGPTVTEHDLVVQFCQQTFHSSSQSEAACELLYKALIISSDAVLKGRYCAAYDKSLNESLMPTGNWMRDDRLGGLKQLKTVFSYLYDHGLLEDALDEKREAVRLWIQAETLIKDMVESMHPAGAAAPGSATTAENQDSSILSRRMLNSMRYARRLFEVIEAGWHVMVLGYRGDQTGTYDIPALRSAIGDYDMAWAAYEALQLADAYTPTLYQPVYLSYEGQPENPGLRDTVDTYRKKLGGSS